MLDRQFFKDVMLRMKGWMRSRGGGDAVPILRKNSQIFLKHVGVDITCFLDAKSSLTKRNRTSETSKLELFTKKVNGLLPNCQLSQKVSP